MELQQKIDALARLRLEEEVLATKIKTAETEVYAEMLAADMQSADTPLGQFVRKATNTWTYSEPVAEELDGLDKELKELKDQQKAIQIKAQKEGEAECATKFSYSFIKLKL